MNKVNSFIMDSTQEVKKPPVMQRFREFLGRKLSFNRIVWLFFYVNMLNYIERFIISGSAVEIEEFVEQSVHGSKDTFLGLLQSAFILGFSIACIIFGYVVKSDSPFTIVCIGLLVWTVASLASGLAFNYWMLLFARLFSGVGEAAFQLSFPPLSTISHRRTTWERRCRDCIWQFQWEQRWATHFLALWPSIFPGESCFSFQLLS